MAIKQSLFIQKYQHIIITAQKFFPRVRTFIRTFLLNFPQNHRIRFNTLLLLLNTVCDKESNTPFLGDVCKLSFVYQVKTLISVFGRLQQHEEEGVISDPAPVIAQKMTRSLLPSDLGNSFSVLGQKPSPACFHGTTDVPGDHSSTL